jgi:hypothetical protein
MDYVVDIQHKIEILDDILQDNHVGHFLQYKFHLCLLDIFCNTNSTSIQSAFCDVSLCLCVSMMTVLVDRASHIRDNSPICL